MAPKIKTPINKKKVSQKTEIQQERDFLRNNVDAFELDLETYELEVKPKSKSQSVKLSSAEANKGISLVDKYRKVEKQNELAEKRHKRYLDFTTQTTIRRDIVNNITNSLTIAMNQKKQQLKDRKDPKQLLFKNRKPKKKPSTSIFSDADFANISKDSQPNKLMQGFERIR